MVRGSTLVAKVEEALQHRTRTIDFTLSAINGHARVLRRSGCSKATQRSVAVAVLRTYNMKGPGPAKYIQLNTKATRADTMKGTSHGVFKVGVWVGSTPRVCR